MELYHSKVNEFIKRNDLKAEYYILTESCHTVEEAAKAINESVNKFVKNICMIDDNEGLIVAVVKGEDRASTTRVSKTLSIERPRLAKEVEILERTGYPAGGVPSFGFPALFLIDPKVIDQEFIYTGGGSPHSLVKITVEEMLRVNNGEVVRLRK